jgi:hypothetical protein
MRQTIFLPATTASDDVAASTWVVRADHLSSAAFPKPWLVHVFYEHPTIKSYDHVDCPWPVSRVTKLSFPLIAVDVETTRTNWELRCWSQNKRSRMKLFPVGRNNLQTISHGRPRY